MSELFEKRSISELLDLDLQLGNKEIHRILNKKIKILKRKVRMCFNCPYNTGKCSVHSVSN